MSDQIDKMLKEMEEFNKKYGLSTAGLSSSPSKSQLRRKGRFSKTQKNRRRYGRSPRSRFCRRHDAECGSGCRRRGNRFRTARSNSTEKNFVSALDKVKQNSPEMSRLKRFRKAFSLGMKGYVKERKQHFQALRKGFRGIAKENGIAAATAAVIAPRSDITAALLQKKKSRD